MLDDGFEDRLKDAARDYNAPPETPREAMWKRIAAERAEGKEAEKTEKTEKTEGAGMPVTPLSPLRHLRPLRWPAGIAALLALGIGLDRKSVV